ncbi:hypothetical protein EYZ11_011960 [Aspergillus tanneri]|nr:hypothetical protein EYZ11_011960 [Aspergillus tanneri]
MPVDLELGMLQAETAPASSWIPPGALNRYPSPTSQESREYHYHAQPNSGATTDGANGSPNWLGMTAGGCPTNAIEQANWQQVFNREWALLSSNDAVAPSNWSPASTGSHSADDGSENRCALGMVQQLSELNVELYAHEMTVPKPPMSVSEPLSWKDKDFAIDRTFHLSQRFIEVLNRQYPRYLETARLSGSETATSDVGLSGAFGLDQGSCLLTLSCYLRLVKTYDNIFGNMQACLDRSSVTPRGDYVNLPGVQVGSFSLPHSSALQIVLILQLARHLLTRMGEVVKAAGLDGQNQRKADKDTENMVLTDGTGDSLLSGAVNTVQSQECFLMNRITKLRNTLIALNIL